MKLPVLLPGFGAADAEYLGAGTLVVHPAPRQRTTQAHPGAAALCNLSPAASGQGADQLTQSGPPPLNWGWASHQRGVCVGAVRTPDAVANGIGVAVDENTLKLR